MKTIFTIIITLIVAGFPLKEGFSVNDLQNCSAELTVEKNRSYKSATENGVEFKLMLKNTSGSTNSFRLSSINLSTQCTNNTDNGLSKSSVENSNVDVSFKLSNSKMSSIGSSDHNIITLDAGASEEFIVIGMVPNGTPYYTWGCIEVKANSISCKSVSDEIILSVYIPDPTEG